MNSYELSRNWFDFTFENPEIIKPVHTAMYFFIIEHCNRLGWKEKFGLPMEMTKDAIGISNYKTYSKTLNSLIEWGFVKLIQKSKNQYSSTIIALVKNTKASTKALTKASLKHVPKQVRGTAHSIVCIDKPINLITNNKIESVENSSHSNFEERKKKFLKWFNHKIKLHTGRVGKFRTMSPTDENNFKRVLKAEYTTEDLNKAFDSMANDRWVIDKKMLNINHFLRIDNLNRYLQRSDEEWKANVI